jgi:hypothetical protein
MADEIYGQSIGFEPTPNGYAATQGLQANQIMAHPPTLDLSQRQMIDSPGGYGSEYSARAYVAPNKQMVYPTIYEGKHHDTEEAFQHAVQTGEHMGIFHSPPQEFYQTNPEAMQQYEQVLGQYENAVHARPIYANGQLLNYDVYQSMRRKRKLSDVKKRKE